MPNHRRACAGWQKGPGSLSIGCISVGFAGDCLWSLQRIPAGFPFDVYVRERTKSMGWAEHELDLSTGRLSIESGQRDLWRPHLQPPAKLVETPRVILTGYGYTCCKETSTGATCASVGEANRRPSHDQAGGRCSSSDQIFFTIEQSTSTGPSLSQE